MIKKPDDDSARKANNTKRTRLKRKREGCCIKCKATDLQIYWLVKRERWTAGVYCEGCSLANRTMVRAWKARKEAGT